MINSSNVVEVITKNKQYLDTVLTYVEQVKEINLAFRYEPILAIKNYLSQHANLLMFPSENLDYGGMVTYKNGRYFVHINTMQPKLYENFVLAHEFFHFYFEAEKIRNSEVQTFADGSTPNEEERVANLFAAELLINSIVLNTLFLQMRNAYVGDKLENQVIRLIQAFKLPYKSLVIKLAQDGLITLDEAVAIIDYDYRNALPNDFDNSLLAPSLSIQFDSVAELINDPIVIGNLRATDHKSSTELYQKHLSSLERLREKKKE